MKSVKPGRGPSWMALISTVFVCVFGVFWTVVALAMGAPWFFPLFGVCFVGIGIAQAVYHYKNATGQDRYSSFDIVDGDEEPDPLNARYGVSPEPRAGSGAPAQADGFCPWCGAPAKAGYRYCRRCGKQL